MNARKLGFTLVELIVVMVITAILAMGLVVFLRPAMTSYVNVVSRAELTDLADTAMRAMIRDIRLAVPNSFRQPSPSCFEVIPTSDGGRYRSGPDIKNSADEWVDTTTTTQTFDVVSPFNTVPASGDWIVVANQNTEDVYDQVNRAEIDVVTVPPAPPVTTPPTPLLGQHRIRLKTALQFPMGYDNSRFVVVPASQGAVFYSCVNANGVDAGGNGKGTLYRYSGYGINPRPPPPAVLACPTAPGPTAHVLATNVSQCVFTFDPNPGAIQGAGYVGIQVQLTKNNESVNLIFGAHTDNLP